MYIIVQMCIFFVLGEWVSVAYNGFTCVGPQVRAVGPRKWSWVLVFLANSALFHYFRQEDQTFLIYLCPNVYIFTQMCIFMTNLIKVSGL